MSDFRTINDMDSALVQKLLREAMASLGLQSTMPSPEFGSGRDVMNFLLALHLRLQDAERELGILARRA